MAVAAGYASVADPLSSTRGISWAPLKKGEQLPSGSLRAGWTPTDGPTYVGIDVGNRGDEVGKINIDEDDKRRMCHFWVHGTWRARKQARVLVCEDSVIPVWRQVTSGNPIPDNALKTADALLEDDSLAADVSHVFSKLGGVKQGNVYVGRYNGEPGTLEVADGCMVSFWGHHWGERKDAEILTLERVEIASGDATAARELSTVESFVKSKEILLTTAAPTGVPKAEVASAASPEAAAAMRLRGGDCSGSEAATQNATAATLKGDADEFMTPTVAATGPDPLGFVPPFAAESLSSAAPRHGLGRLGPDGGCVKVLQFNIWQEGWEVSDGCDKIADVIHTSCADIVALSEVRNWSANNLPVPFNDFHLRLKKKLMKLSGNTWYGSWVEGCDTGLVTTFPIAYAESVTEAARSFIASYRLVTPVGHLCVCSAHLDWKNYALNLVRGYDANTFRQLPKPVTDVAALLAMDTKSGRRQSLEDFIHYAGNQDCPMILAGDFNESSHLDWTEATKDTYGHAGVVIEWKHSKLLQDDGFIDSWRELYPDPATHMGATWPSQAHGKSCTSWAKSADERDRIDFIYYKSARLRPLAGCIVGPKGYFVMGQPADCTCESPFLPSVLEKPWPSDHKGVMVEFKFEPASKGAS